MFSMFSMFRTRRRVLVLHQCMQYPPLWYMNLTSDLCGDYVCVNVCDRHSNGGRVEVQLHGSTVTSFKTSKGKRVQRERAAVWYTRDKMWPAITFHAKTP